MKVASDISITTDFEQSFFQVKLVVQISFISLGIKDLREVLFGAWNPFDLIFDKAHSKGTMFSVRAKIERVTNDELPTQLCI